MIQSLSLNLPQGIPLHSACIEIFNATVKGTEVKEMTTLFSRDESGKLGETDKQGAESVYNVNEITFTAQVWVNHNTRAAGKPSFDLMDENRQKEITIDLDVHPEIGDYFDNFDVNATDSQRVEMTCEKFIKEIFVNKFRS